MRIGLKMSSAGATMTSEKVIAGGFSEHTDPDALVVGPTGVGLGPNGTLYVAGAVANRIAAIPSAMTRTTKLMHGGMTVSKGKSLNDPLGLAIAPNGNIVSMNGADGRAVETTPAGQAVRQDADQERRRRPVRARPHTEGERHLLRQRRGAAQPGGQTRWTTSLRLVWEALAAL